MAKTVYIPNGKMTFVDVDFNCPQCECPHTEEDYYEQLVDSDHSVLYMPCKGCKTELGITGNIQGDVVFWLKSEEEVCPHSNTKWEFDPLRLTCQSCGEDVK